MFRRLLMAAISNIKGKSVIGERTSPATTAMGKKKAQVRNFSSKSSPIYKTQSDTSLVNGMKNLSLRDKTNSPSRPNPPRRAYGSGKGTIRNLSDVADVLRHQEVKNVVIVAGAGISTPSGIPDFRTPGTGLYDNLQQYKIPYPEAIFDIDYFGHNPRPFFTLAKELYPSGKYRPNYIHYFARLLHDKGMLLRMYTQNIDGLERLAGIPPNKMVEAHGTFATATCVICSQKYNGEDIKEKIFDDKIPRCKRTACPGMIKPDIVFFGEELPKRFYYYLKDMLQTDLVLVMGTSLEVQPFAGIIDNVRWSVPRVLFNMKAVGPFRHNKRSKDVVAEGDLLETMQKFVGMMDWKTEMADLITKREGEFKIASPPAQEKTTPSIPVVKPNQPESVMWRQKARLDLFKTNFYFSSSESSSSQTESESSDDDEKSRNKPSFTRGKGLTNNSRLQNSKNDQPTRKYGTSAQHNLTSPLNKKPPLGSWMKSTQKQTEKGSSLKQNDQSCITNGKDKRETNRLYRPQSDSSRPLTRCSSSRKGTPTQSNSAPRKITADIASVNGQRTYPRQGRTVAPGVRPRGQFTKPAVQPSSKTRAVQQQRVIDRQKTLFRVGSAEVPRLTYRHRLPNSAYTNKSSSESSSQDSSSDDEDDNDSR